MERAVWATGWVVCALLLAAPSLASSIELEQTMGILDECALQVRLTGDGLLADSTQSLRSWDTRTHEKGVTIRKAGHRVNACAEQVVYLSERLSTQGFRSGETPETVLSSTGDRLLSLGGTMVIRPEARCKIAGRELRTLGDSLVEKSKVILEEIESIKAAVAEGKRLARLEQERAREAAARKPEKKVVTHKVRAGDTLSKIARRYYRDYTLWKKIYQANRDQLADPADLEVGQELVIP